MNITKTTDGGEKNSELERLRKIESYRVEDKKAFDALRDNRNELEKQLAAANAEVRNLKTSHAELFAGIGRMERDALRAQLAAANARLDELPHCQFSKAELVAQVLALRQLIAGLCKAGDAMTIRAAIDAAMEGGK